MRVSIFVNNKLRVRRKHSLFDDVAMGFTNMIGSMVKLPATQSQNLSECSQISDVGTIERNDIASPSSRGTTNHPVTFQEVWGNIAKPFMKQPKVVPVVNDDKGCHNGTHLEVSATSKDGNRKNGLRKTRTDTTVCETAFEKSRVKKNSPPAWVSQSNLAGFGSLFGRNSLHKAKMTPTDEDDGSDMANRSVSNGERPKSQNVLEALFRKPSEKGLEADEASSIGADELKSVPSKFRGNDVWKEDAPAESTPHKLLAQSTRDHSAIDTQDDDPTSLKDHIATDSVSPVNEILSAQNALFARALAHIKTVKEARESLFKSASQSEDRCCSSLASDLCRSIERVLSLSMRNRPKMKKPAPPAGIKFFTDLVEKIPSRQNTPFHVLCDAQQMILEASTPFDLGVDTIESMAFVSGSSERLHAWIRSSLNAQCLEKRMEYLIAKKELWNRWYEDGSGMSSDELRSKLVSALEGLDGLSFFLHVDKSAEKEEINHVCEEAVGM